MKRLLFAAATLFAMGLGLAASSVQAGDCKVTCYKHPITGALICTPPCP